MTQGNRQSIGRIMRFRNHLEPEQKSHHLLDLLFVSTAVADNGLLDLEWAVLLDRQTSLDSRQKRHPARMPQLRHS